MRKKTENVGETTDFETALNLTGFGRFHYELIAACALSVVSLGFQNGLASYIFPSAQCELSLTSFVLGLLNVAFLVGGAASSFLWGTLSDAIGRRKILATCHFLDVLSTCVCAINPHASSLLAGRFLNGFAIGGPGSVIYSYLAEFQPEKYRSAVVTLCGLFFTSSWLLLPVTAYGVLQIDVSYTVGQIVVLTPWRIFMIILVIPELIVGLWFLRLPESPKFYVAKGDVRNALIVLRRMYSTNTSKLPDEFPVKNLLEAVKVETNVVGKSQNKIWRDFFKTTKTIPVLFKPPQFKSTFLTCTIMFTNMFGTFGLGLWLPELFIRFEQFHKQYPNHTVTVNELSRLEQTVSDSCVPSFDIMVMLSTVAMAISAMIYNLICSLMSSKVKVKTVLMVSTMLSSASAASIYFLTSSMQNLVVACIFQATAITSNMAIGTVSINLFPTKAAGMALCLVMFFGRIGAGCSNLVFGYFMDSNCEIPIFAVAVVMLLGGILCLLIPDEATEDVDVGKTKNNQAFVVETKFIT